jgi:hypothetical protein
MSLSVNNSTSAHTTVTPQAEKLHVQKLPTCVLRKVQSYLPKESARSFQLTCKDWKDLSRNDGRLDLSHSDITDADLARILQQFKDKKEKITSLDLSSCRKITDAGLAHLSTLALTELNLCFTGGITDEGLAHLKTLPLTKLNLSWLIMITGTGLAHLSALPLKNLDLSYTNIKNAGLAQLKTPLLTHLNLKSCQWIGNAGIAHLSALALTHLDLSDNFAITNAGLAHLKDLPLTHLNLEEVCNITNDGLAHICDLPLTDLNLRRIRNITEIGLLHFVTNPELNLNLQYTGVSEVEHRSYLLFNHFFHQVSSFVDEDYAALEGVQAAQKIRSCINGYLKMLSL